MNEDLTNKDMVIYDNSPKDIMKDYLEVSLYSKVELLEVDQVWRKRMCEWTTSGLYRNEKYNIKYEFFFSMYTP